MMQNKETTVKGWRRAFEGRKNQIKQALNRVWTMFCFD